MDPIDAPTARSTGRVAPPGGSSALPEPRPERRVSLDGLADTAPPISTGHDEPQLFLTVADAPDLTAGYEITVPTAANRRSLVGRNFAVLLASQVITWSLALVLTIVTPRFLGPEGVGQLRLGAAVWAIAIVFADLGTAMPVTLEFARDQVHGYSMLSPVIRLRVAGAGIASLVVLAFVILAGYDLETSVIIGIVGIGVMVLMIADVARSALYGMQWMAAAAKADVITKIVTVIAVVGVLVAGGRTGAVAVAMIVPAVAVTVLLWRALFSRREHARAAEHRPSAASVLRTSSPFFFGSVILAVYGSIDVVVISLVATSKEIGWYAAGTVLIATLLFVPTILMTSLFPALAQVHGEDPGAVPELLSRAVRTMMIVAVAIGLGTIVVANPIVTTLFGQDFRPAGPVLATFGIVLMLMFQTILLGGFARAVGKLKVFNVAMTIATLLTFPLDLVFVPWTRDRFGNGAIGGALSYVCTEALILVILTWKVAPVLVERRTLVRVGKCAIAGAAMLVVSWPLREQFVAIPVIAGAVVYTSAILLLRVLDDDERQMVRKLGRRIKSMGPAGRRTTTVNEA